MSETTYPTSEAPDDAETAAVVHTFLIADVRGYTRFTQEQGDEAAAQLVAKFAALMRDGVETHGGRVIELLGDEALALFSSARQALRAAIELQNLFARGTEADPSLPLPVGIGLDAGEAVPVEGGYRGEALNLASRLCNLAEPGEVLASEGVVYLARRVPGLAYLERGLVPLKGFADPVRVIRVVPEAEAEGEPASGPGTLIAISPLVARQEESLPIGGFLGALPSGRLVGREEEWEQIMAALDGVGKGTGRLVLLSGEPGIGKTRLAQEVTLKVRHWGFLVATGRCYEQEESVPYYPFLDALSTMYDLSPPAIRAEIPRRWPYLARLLPEPATERPAYGVAGVPPNAGPGPSPEEQQRLFRAVTGLFQAIAATVPVALLLDDLHWADDSSLKLLQHLARHTRSNRVLLFGTYRDVEIHRQHPLEAMLLDLEREQLVEEIEVRRLSREGTAALVTEILGEKDDLEKLVELVYHRTEGNPFFIQEVLHALVERGDVYRKDGRWEQRTSGELEVPKSVRAVIGQRLSRLDEDDQEILREASVLGQRFAFDDLMALGALAPWPGRPLERREQPGWTEDQVEAAIEHAIVASLLRDTGGDTYAFNHGLTQQTLYAELSTRRRKRLHLAAGKALERLSERERKRRAGELAWHFLEGDDAEAALPYVMLAGDEAESVFAHDEAERQYRTALELARELDDGTREVEALEKLGGVLALVARYDQALTVLEEAAQLYREMSDVEGEARAVSQIGQIHYRRDTAEEGIARLQPLVRSLEERRAQGEYPQGAPLPPSHGLAALWAALARLYIDTDKPKEELEAAERAVELARASGDDRVLLGAEVTRSDALWRLGQDDDALRVLEEMISRAEGLGDLDNLARALGNAADYYGRRGELEKDRAYNQRALDVAERRGDLGQILLAEMSLSATAFLRGDWKEARVYLDQAETLIRPLSNDRLAMWPTAARAWFALREGDLQAAGEYAAEARSMAEELCDPVWIQNTQRLLAEKALLEGRPEEALAALARRDEDQPASRSQPEADFLWTLAWAQAELGNEQEAHETAEAAVAKARESKGQPSLVEALVVAGMVDARASGRWEEAEAHLRDALSRARQMAFPFGEARALRELGIMYARKGAMQEAQKSLEEALAIFRQLGAKKDAERTEQALMEGVPS